MCPFFTCIVAEILLFICSNSLFILAQTRNECRVTFRFKNGTGTRCWVAGWGRNEATGAMQVRSKYPPQKSSFMKLKRKYTERSIVNIWVVWQVVQRKVDIPIVDKATCQTKIQAAINAKKPGTGDKVTISPSEVSTSPLPLQFNVSTRLKNNHTLQSCSEIP